MAGAAGNSKCVVILGKKLHGIQPRLVQCCIGLRIKGLAIRKIGVFLNQHENRVENLV